MKRYFTKNEQGDWEHYIDEDLRATITEENLADYKKRGGYEDDQVK